MSATTIEFERAAMALAACVPRFSTDESRLARALYRALAAGESVTTDRMADVLGLPTARIATLLEGERLRCLVQYDAEGSVVGFGGLAVVPMHHRLLVKERTLYAWCAWDSLFLPRVLAETARVESTCPETDEMIRLTVSPERAEVETHTEPVVSFLLPRSDTFSGDTSTAMASFCHHVFFFATREAGARWTAGRPGTFLLTVEQAFELGRRLDALRSASLESREGRS